MRIFIAALFTETNTFAPFPTGRSGFEENGVRRDTSTVNGPMTVAMGVFRSLAEADGHEVVESLACFAQPSGVTVRAVYEDLRDTILSDLRAAGPIDVVLLFLHGAMVAQGYDDCEGDILARAREIAPAAVIGAELDPHCHLTELMVAAADLVLIAREYPHIDFSDRAGDLYRLCLSTARGEIRPVPALVDCRMVGFYPTFDPPMKAVVEDLRARSRAEGIVSVELAHGFPWADVADVGTRVLVYADGDAGRAGALAEEVAAEIYARRRELVLSFPSIEASLERARGLNGRVVLGDFADNPGGGAPGDSTFFLRALVERGVDDAVVGTICDPGMARICADAGVGAVLPLRLGGKCGPTSGDPLDLEVEVMAINENLVQDFFGAEQSMGLSAWVRAGGIDIVLASNRSQVYTPEVFTGLGVPMENRRLVVVKSSNHYRAGFEPVSDHLWHVASPGCMSLDFTGLPYSKLNGPTFPMAADPWAVAGAPQARLVARQA